MRYTGLKQYLQDQRNVSYETILSADKFDQDYKDKKIVKIENITGNYNLNENFNTFNENEVLFCLNGKINNNYQNYTDFYLITGVGAVNDTAYSYDGINWVGLGSLFSTGGNFIFFDGIKYLLYGSTGDVLKISYDGINYTSFNYANLNNIKSIVKGNNIYIAACTGGADTLAYSFDGINWIGLGNLTHTIQTNRILFDGSKFISVGRVGNTIAYSYDGINWNGLGLTIFDIIGSYIFYDGSLYIAGGRGINTLAYSYDGINWTGLGSLVVTSNPQYITKINNIYFCCSLGLNTLSYSFDGINWVGLGNVIFGTASYRIIYHNGIYVSCGYPTNSLAYSYDGINWVGLGVGIFTQCFFLFHDGRKFVACGNGANTIAYSYNGIEWIGLGTGVINTQGTYLYNNLTSDQYNLFYDKNNNQNQIIDIDVKYDSIISQNRYINKNIDIKNLYFHKLQSQVNSYLKLEGLKITLE